MAPLAELPYPPPAMKLDHPLAPILVAVAAIALLSVMDGAM